jgi:putative tryptophan/tyrosine transport system substrate-binding protein
MKKDHIWPDRQQHGGDCAFGRRRVLRILSSTPFLLATDASAQAKRLVAIGYLAVGSQNGTARFFTAFNEGLASLGWTEGTNYTLVARWADSDLARLDRLAGEIAARAPAIVVAAPTPAVIAAAKALPSVPIVQANGSDPVEIGLVESFARPGGMITGLTNIIGEVSEKYLDLLLVVVPQIQCVGFLFEPDRTNLESVESARSSIAHRRVESRFASAAKVSELEPAIAKLAVEGAQALVVLSGSFFPSERKRIVGAALSHRWPIMSGLREFTDEGGLMSYGADRSTLYRRAAYYVDKILKGAQPRDLPIERPTKFDLVINLRTAKALGLAIPQSLLLRADEVIQ